MDILDLSKIEANKFQLEEKKICIESLLANVALMLSDRVNKKNLRLTVGTDNLPRYLMGDATRIQQAILNYAHNALKFTETGEITLKAEKLEENDHSVLVKFEVRDTGIGIDEHTLARLFNAFEQAEVSTTKQYGGTGLGLAINKNLAELMGGSVGAESSPGFGSCFWFTARLKKTSQLEQNSTQQDVESALEQLKKQFSHARILLAEDDLFNQEVSMYQLESIGFQVDVVDNGASAVEKARDNHYDIILMDIQMPIMNGLDATRAIRLLANQQQTPILALTANAFNDHRQSCLDVGMNDHISKPIDRNKLYQTLLKWLQKTPFEPFSA